MWIFNEVPDISGNLFPNLSTLIAHIIACIIIMYFLIRWAWKPFKKSQEEREKYIFDSIKKAENAKILAKLNVEKTYENLNDAKIESARIIDGAKADAELYRVEKMHDVNKEITRLTEEAKNNIESEKIKLLETSKKEIIDISFILAEKIIKKNISKTDNEKIIKEVLDEYKKN